MYLHSTVSAPNLRRSAELSSDETSVQRTGSKRSRRSVGRLSRFVGQVVGGLSSSTPTVLEEDENHTEDNDQRERREAYEQLQRQNTSASRSTQNPPRTSSATSPPLRSRAPSACSSESRSSVKQLSKMSAQLDAQLGALGSVFARIRTNASLKQSCLAITDHSVADLPTSSNIHDTHNTNLETPQRPAIPRSASTSALAPAPSGAPGTAPYRVDSGFARSELDLLYADLMCLSLSQFTEKHATTPALLEEDEEDEEKKAENGRHAVAAL
ncbi:hypothetical protein HDU86_008387 [Geranomyces michiganensis]|nr:hypothetical protein HDU86_008387 [Geranomyces michiganensis]